MTRKRKTEQRKKRKKEMRELKTTRKVSKTEMKTQTGGSGASVYSRNAVGY